MLITSYRENMAAACGSSKLAAVFVASRAVFQSHQILKFRRVSNVGDIGSPAVIFRYQSTGIPPKKPGNSFIQFSNENRSRLTAENPEESLKEITKRLSQLWRALPEEEKDKYTQKAKMLEEKFQEEVKEFESSLSSCELEELKEEKRQKRKKRAKRRAKILTKKLEKPKQPRPAFSYFVVSQASDVHEFHKDLMVRLSEEWNNMTEEEKAVYLQKAEEDKLRYKREMDDWEDRMVLEGHPELIRKGTMNKLMKKTQEEQVEF